MILTNKYPEGEWEDSEMECPVCGDVIQQYVVEEMSPNGRTIEYEKGERCLTCDWKTDFSN